MTRRFASSNHICYVCKTRECSTDNEGGRVSYYSTCDKCFGIPSGPYCYADKCHKIMGTQTELVNAGPDITASNAIYRCPNGCGQATRIGWGIGSARQSARQDAQAKLDGTENAWLVDTRLEHIGKNYNAEHPLTRATSRAYVDTAKALLGV